MWTLISLGTILASFLVLMRTLRALDSDRLSILVIGLIWTRFALTALGEPALRPVAAGQSLLAIGTLGLTAVAILVVPLHRYRDWRALPFFGFIALAVLSGVLNGRIGALVNAVVLWAMFLVCALLLHRAFQIHGARPVLRCLLAAFALPLAMQAMSVATNRSLVGMDGTISYVGNYAHEAVFATVALALLWLVTLYPWRHRGVHLSAFAVVLASLALSNYRTMMLAALPLLFALAIQFLPGRQLRRAVVPVTLGALLLAALAPLLPGGRFDEIGLVLNEFGSLVKPPQEYTFSEQRILSARGFIAASYVQDFIAGSPVQQIVGFGPGAQARNIAVHPHNEYLRMMFEFGLVGLALWVGLLIRYIAIALGRIAHPVGLVVASGYGAILIGSLGTSFFNRPEGMILLAMLCSVTWYLAEPRAVTPEAASALRSRRPVV
ncbi:hypothetical protein [Oceaniglobus indicus]|uniref:hypothetical protein n=1 Tax=Oceaniglobus indicus TaxID=2047749 RepID=UPI000C18086C|nr:hypothetical protein [Oceaniglobus indicus]